MKLKSRALWLGPLTVALVVSGCIPRLASTPVPKPGKIAFSSIRDGNGEIYVMNADGMELVQLTHDPADDVGPAWSPDGKRIAFTSNRDGNAEVYMMNADGTEPVNLTDNPANDSHPAWSH
jgi:Tol biopolymer transport system component